MIGIPTSDVFLVAGAVAVAISLLIVYRVYAGPSMQDRVIALNIIGSNAVVVIALVAAGFDQPSFLDIALVYALLNFLLAIAISKFTVDRGGVL